jgi:hypothetical protein
MFRATLCSSSGKNCINTTSGILTCVSEEIVRQVVHLPELYEDARLEKYKTLFTYSICS